MAASAAEAADAERLLTGVETGGGEGWVLGGEAVVGGAYEDMGHPAATHSRAADAAPAPAPAPAPAAAGAGTVGVPAGEEDDEYADMGSFVDRSLLVADAGAVPTPPRSAPASAAGGAGVGAPAGASVVRVRTYDVTVAYDNFYRTPRVYIKGYDEEGAALSPGGSGDRRWGWEGVGGEDVWVPVRVRAEGMLEDVQQDYVNRTATIETHPHLLGSGPWIRWVV
jgi:hypothetical protein